jgi:hypothetical protein
MVRRSAESLFRIAYKSHDHEPVIESKGLDHPTPDEDSQANK